MKLFACLSLLAILTAACGGSKGSSDKSPAATPVVTVDTSVDTHNPSKPSTGSANNEANNSGNTQTPVTDNSQNTKPVEEVSNPLPETFVGFGFNTINNQVRESCLTGKTVLDTGASSSTVSFNRYENYEAFYTKVLKAKEGSILDAWAGSDFQDKFFKEESNETLSSNYVFASSVTTGTKRFSDSRLAVSLNPIEFQTKCGNSFIASAVVGGSFVAKVSLSFANETAKKELSNQTFDYAKLTKLLVQESKTVASERRVASVEISYGQIGGGGVILTHLNTNDILKCSLDSQDEAQMCAATLEKLASYAVSQSFLDSIKKDPAVFSFSLSSY